MKDSNLDFWYLASPYSKYPRGKVAAYEKVSEQAGLLIKNGVKIYCPIAHSHPIALYGNVDPDSHDIWLPVDKAIFQHAKGMIVCMMDTWQQSYGVNWEIKEFTAVGLPIVYMEVDKVPEVFLNGGS